MIGLFIPIFLLVEGFSLFEVLIFLMAYMGVGMALFSPLGLKIASKKGLKHTMMLSGPVKVIFFIVLYNIGFFRVFIGDLSSIILISILISFADALYWSGYHVEFGKYSEKKKSMKQVGTLNILSTIMAAISPLIGALIITSFGFKVMFIIVMLLIVVSTLPLFLSKEHHIPFHFSLKDLTKKKRGDYVLPFFAEGFKGIASSIAWPLMLYFIFVSYTSIGSIYTISTTLVVLTTLFISHRVTEATKIILLKLGTYLHSLTMIVRIFVKNFLVLNFVQGLGGISWAMIALPFLSSFYNYTKEIGTVRGTLFREIYLSAGRTVAILIIMASLFFLTPEMALGLIIILGSLATLAMGTIKDTNKK